MIEVVPAVAGLAAAAGQWDAAATRAGSPYLTTAWLRAWADSRPGDVRCLLVRDGDRLLAGACFRDLLAGRRSAADVHTGAWTVVGEQPQLGWASLVGPRWIHLDAIPPGDAAAARDALAAAGYRVSLRAVPAGPRVALPADPDDVLAMISRGLRSQWRRKRRALAELGPLRLRTSGPGDVEEDLRRFLELEHAGWKREAGTSILSDPRDVALYAGFARAAADRGLLRLQLLEVGDRLVAADLSAGMAGTVFMLKTAYDEQLARHSPGLVLRGEALRSAVADGFTGYDLLGGPEDYKLRWGGRPQARVALRAYRGPGSRAADRLQREVRPLLAATRRAVAARRERADRGGSPD